MRKDREKDQAFIAEVKQKLDWYINDASDKEYDEKAVASLEYLLETIEPTDDFKVDEEKAWVEFKDYVEQREAHGGAKGDKSPKIKSHPAFLSHYKGLVAAAILVLILAVSISTSSEAVRDNGFFHWIREMVGGREMITVPDSLDEVTEFQSKTLVTERDDVPQEWEEWSNIEQIVMGDDEFEWKHIEIKEHSGKVVIQSHYNYKQRNLIIGILEYANEMQQGTEMFDRFDKYDTWEVGDMEFDLSRMCEENRTVCSIEFFDSSHRYYIIVDETDIDKAKELAVEYKKNIK